MPTNEEKQALARAIRYARGGLTQVQFGKLVGVTGRTVCNWEGGHRAPSAWAFAAIMNTANDEGKVRLLRAVGVQLVGVSRGLREHWRKDVRDGGG